MEETAYASSTHAARQKKKFCSKEMDPRCTNHFPYTYGSERSFPIMGPTKITDPVLSTEQVSRVQESPLLCFRWDVWRIRHMVIGDPGCLEIRLSSMIAGLCCIINLPRVRKKKEI